MAVLRVARMNVLLVGGPADGRRCTAYAGMQVISVARLPRAIVSRLDRPPTEATLTYHVENYQIYPLCERGGERLYVGLHESLNPHNLLAHLMAGYKHEVQP